jgi:beta-lactamase class A
MKYCSRGQLACFGLAVSILVFARQGEAALGGTAASVASDRTALSAVHRATTSHSAYTVQEYQSGSSTVREYVSASGVVFAIVWNGRAHPDLTTLLGSYSSEYQTALQQTVRKRGLRRQQVQSDGVIVEKWGHMRNLQGRAYAPALIPTGVTIDEIK